MNAFPSLARLVGLFALALSLSLQPGRSDEVAMDEFGVCVDVQSLTDPVPFCDQLIASGVKWVRMSPSWEYIETAKGVYSSSYLARLDTIVNRLHAGDVNILWILCYTPQWASSQPGLGWPDATRYKPANWADWESYVTFITSRYNGKVMHWEVWNEPDLIGFWKSSTADYAELLTRASSKIKATNPANTVLLGGLALTHDGVTDSYGLGTFFDTLLGIAGVGSAFDVVNYHAYGNLQRQSALHGGMLAVTAKYGIGSRPIWITETGYTTGGTSAKEALKADRVDQTWLNTTRRGDVARSFFYTYRNPVLVPANPSEENFGLCASNLTPLRAFYHYQGLGGAKASPALQTLYPALADSVRALHQVAPGSGDGSGVQSYHVIPTTRYAYYRVDDSWIYNANETTYVDVTYLDTGTALFALHYDATGNSYQGLSKTRTNTGAWLTHTFTLTGSKFANRENYLSDFRLASGGTDLAVRSVVLRRASDSSTRQIVPVPATSGDGAYVTEQSRIPVGKYMYLRAHDTWVNDTNQGLDDTLYVDVTYLDSGTSSFGFHYDSTSNAYQGLSQTRTNTGAWLTRTFVLSNAKLANRQNYSADMRLNPGAADLVVKSVVLYRSLNPAVALLGTTSALKLIAYNPDTDSTHIGYNPVATQGGVECRSITANNRYCFFEVCDGLVASTNTNLTITVTFWDAGTDKLAVTYNAIGNPNKTITITKTNTLQWRTASVTVTDAQFQGTQSYFADFNIGNNSDGSAEYIRKVAVAAN